MSNVCEICDYKLNSTVRKLVCCPYCEFTACRTCCETYILGETTSKCMNPPCNREWTRQFIAKSFTDVFLNKKLKKGVKKYYLILNDHCYLLLNQELNS
jgi:hypothetical protein